MHSPATLHDPTVSRPTFFSRLVRALHYSGAKLLVAIGLLIIATPFMYDLPDGGLVESVLLTLVMVFAVLEVGERRRSLIIAIVLVTPALAGKWINHFQPQAIPPIIFVTATILLFGFVVFNLLHFIVRAPQIDANVLCTSMAGFLLLGLLWAPVYLLVADANPNAFTVASGTNTKATLDGFTAFYFSFITLCTVGYGDVAPVSNAARMLAVLESITGLFYMGILISRLVSIHSSSWPSKETKNGKGS